MMRKHITNIRNIRITGKNLIYITLTAILLIATVIVAASGFRAPGKIEKTDTLVSYNLKSSLSHQAYGYLSPSDEICVACGETDLVYFPEIIESASGAYIYEFLSEGKVTDVKTQVQINAILSRSGMWSKMLELLPSKVMSGTSVAFPLDPKGYLELANTISEELGLGKVSSIELILTANVQTEAKIDGTIIKDNLTQTCQISLSTTMMKWTKPLDLSWKGYQANKAYEQRGRFGYQFKLGDNTLFGATTLESPLPEVRTLRKLPQASGYLSDVIGKMDVNFAYNLVADKTVSDVNNEVEASAVLSNIDGEQVVFPLMTAQQFPGDFTVKLPIDVTLLYDIIKKMENTTKNDFKASYDLMVKVDVRTTASTPGAIDQIISAVLPMKLNASGLQVETATDTSKTGSITKTTLVSNSSRSTLLMISLSLLALTLIAGLWTGWKIWESRREPSFMNELWETTQQTAEKHKDNFVNVLELPAPSETENITQIDSLAELVKLADSLLKPILHQKDAERHIYCVIDGMARYVYVILEPPPKQS